MSVIEQNQAFFPTPNGLAPSNPEKGGFIRQNITLGAGVAATLAMSTLQNEEILDTLQTLFIDNSTGANPVTIETGIGKVRYTIPGYSQAILPTFNVRGEQYSFTRADAGTLQIIFLNMPLPSLVWSVNAAGAIVTVANTVAVSVADGADVALGTTTDAAETDPTQAATVIALLKGILEVSGTTGHAVTIADGADVALGDTGDAAETNPGSAATLIALAKGLLTLAIAIEADTSAILTNTADIETLITNRLPVLGQALMAASSPVVIASDQSTVGVNQDGGATGTRSSVAGSSSDVQLLAANTARKGATVFNDSTAVLYLGLGATAASTTNYTTQIAPGGFYEVSAGFRGQVRGIWASATGNARVTELT